MKLGSSYRGLVTDGLQNFSGSQEMPQMHNSVNDVIGNVNTLLDAKIPPKPKIMLEGSV